MTELTIAVAQVRCQVCQYFINAGDLCGKVNGLRACEYCTETQDDFEEVLNEQGRVRV